MRMLLIKLCNHFVHLISSLVIILFISYQALYSSCSPLQVGDKTRQPESYAAVSLHVVVDNDNADAADDDYKLKSISLVLAQLLSKSDNSSSDCSNIGGQIFASKI